MNRQYKREDVALRLHGESIVIDALGNAPTETEGRVAYFDELIKAGVTAVNITASATNDSPLQAMKRLSAWYDLFENQGSKIIQVHISQDIERAKREGKLGIILGTQNAEILGDDLSLLPVYKRLGLRVIQLSYYMQNLLGEGCAERTDSGLSSFGIEVVKEMNRLGLLIDVAHSGGQVTTDAIKYSDSPILITHSNLQGMVKHIRNKTDEQVRALADKGGVIGLVLYSPFCEVRENARPTLEDFLDIIDYAVGLVGPDYVGLGLDLNPFWGRGGYEEFTRLYPGLAPRGGWLERTVFTDNSGLDNMGRMLEITEGLVTRGYSDSDVEKILGLNFLRVFKEVCG